MGEHRVAMVHWSPEQERKMVRLISYNIQRGIQMESLLDLFAEVPAFREVDVIAIQEASFHADGRNILQELAEVLSPEHRWSYRTVMKYPDKEYGNGFLFRDKVEVLDSYRVTLPRVGKLRWFEKQKTEGGKPDTKAAFVQSFRVDDLLVRIANVHLDFSGGAEHRNAQLGFLLSEMAAREQEHDRGKEWNVLCGDFNTIGQYRLASTTRSRIKSMQVALAAGFVDATESLKYTSDLFGNVDPADPAAAYLNFGKKMGMRFRQKTDHILVEGPASSITAGVVDFDEKKLFKISDHLPVWINWP